MLQPKTFNFTGLQKTLLGIAFAFWLIYKFVLKDPQIIKDLGASYGVYLQLWLMVTLASAGLSGWQLGNLAWEIMKDKVKDKLKKIPNDTE